MTFQEEAARNQKLKNAQAVIEACKQVVITVNTSESTADQIERRIEQVASDIKMYSLDKPAMNKLLMSAIVPVEK